ncbi:MAG TPA: response regulator [Nitrospirota bacterium]|nr:response regulator [Nitrospirota bacterium]
MLTKVLIVDDSEQLQQMYKIILKRYKCDVITALHRDEGLLKLSDNPDVNLIIADMNMHRSHMSGVEFIQKVKEQEAFKDTPIIVVSTYSREDNIEEALARAEGHLSKPFTSNEVHALIERISPLSVAEPKASQRPSMTMKNQHQH